LPRAPPLAQQPGPVDDERRDGADARGPLGALPPRRSTRPAGWPPFGSKRSGRRPSSLGPAPQRSSRGRAPQRSSRGRASQRSSRGRVSARLSNGAAWLRLALGRGGTRGREPELPVSRRPSSIDRLVSRTVAHFRPQATLRAAPATAPTRRSEPPIAPMGPSVRTSVPSKSLPAVAQSSHARHLADAV
jgi:hypothetical protein